MSGLFGGALQSPPERQEALLRKALEARRLHWFAERGAELRATRGYIYDGAGDLLLRHGKFYSGRELPEEYQHLFRCGGGVGQCFTNAYEATGIDSSLRYCEGVYAIGAGMYVPHAWCLDPDGQLLELTLPTDPETIAKGKEHLSKQPILSLDRWGYWGVVIHREYMRACGEQDDGVGVLDRPAGEHHDGLDPENYREWREHWPIYTVPYDPNRRTP